MQQSVPREKVWFSSGGTRCAAWHYPGEPGACVVMAAGTGVTKEPGTDRFAGRGPRQVARISDQLADWQAAAPDAELLRVPGGHYAPFLEAHERVVDAEVGFLRRHLLDAPAELPIVGEAR